MIPPAMWCGHKLLGSAGSANGYGLALDPSGGVVVTGASTADLTTTSVADGNNDSFVARYDASGNQTWIKQIQTLATNQANAVSVDASGNIYIGGSGFRRRDRRGPDRAGRRRRLSRQVRFQGQAAGRKPVRHQRRRSGRRHRHRQRRQPLCRQRAERRRHRQPNMPTATSPRRRSGPRIWARLRPAAPSAASTVSGGQVYVSGTTSNGNLTAGGAGQHRRRQHAAAPMPLSSISPTMAPAPAPIMSPMSAPPASDQGGAVTVGSDGTVYLTGTTTGTFAGQQRNVAERQQRLRHRASTPMAACNGPSNMAAPTASRPAPAWRSIPRLQRAGCAGPAARHHQSQPVGRSDLADHVARRRHLPDQDRGHGAAHRHHHHRSRARRSIRWPPRSTPSWAAIGKASGQLHRQCRRPEDHGQSRQHHRPDRRARRFRRPGAAGHRAPAC